MSIRRAVVGVAFGCLMAAGAVEPARAGLQIELVYIDTHPQPGSPLVEGGGRLQTIMQVAADNWERVFKDERGTWTLRIEYGWAPLRDRTFFAQERMVGESGRPSRITHSCVLFNTNPILEPGAIDGFFADRTPRDNSEYLAYGTDAINTGNGWLNIGRIFSEPTGDAVARIDLLQVAMHEIGHALGLDSDYSGWRRQLPGTFGQLEVTRPRPHAGFEFFITNTGHIDLPQLLPLMYVTPTAGHRQLISGADALALAQLSSFDRPNLSAPALEPDEADAVADKRRAATSRSSSVDCQALVRDSDNGVW